MNHSIYHFFAQLAGKRDSFKDAGKLSKFPFPEKHLSLYRKNENALVEGEEKESGRFPDLAIKITPHHELFSGGELIELKDSRTYSIASFNSTIPTGQKNIADVAGNESGGIYREMTRCGDDVRSLPVRQVYYLVRGRNIKKNHVKVCLVHGSFFETVKKEKLIQEAFRQVLDEQLERHADALSDETKRSLEIAKNDFVALFDRQDAFSKTRPVERASVKLRFRIMTGATPEGNILNAARYKQILDDTLNLVVPVHVEQDKAFHADCVELAFKDTNLEKLLANLSSHKEISHPYNGKFLVHQIKIDNHRHD